MQQLLPLQMRLAEVAVRLDYKRDESYTPSMLSIRAGTSDLATSRRSEQCRCTSLWAGWS